MPIIVTFIAPDSSFDTLKQRIILLLCIDFPVGLVPISPLTSHVG